MSRFSQWLRGRVPLKARWTWLGLFLVGGLGLLIPEMTAQAKQKKTASKQRAPKVICDRLIDDFSSSKVGHFPRGWRTREADEMPLARSLGSYTVIRDKGRNVLRARYKQEAITIGKSIPNWDINQYPLLQWEWKAVKLPKNADERSLGSNDSAASVYAVWNIGFPFYLDGIRYAWSSTVPPGTRIWRRFNHDQVLIKESGTTHLGKWRRVRVNVLNNHNKFFNRKRGRNPSALALLTDADATSSQAEAYYANFRLCRFAK